MESWLKRNSSLTEIEAGFMQVHSFLSVWCIDEKLLPKLK